MVEKTKKCNICGRETDYSLNCIDCTQLTNAVHLWLRSLKKDKKKLSEFRIKVACQGVDIKVSSILNKTLKEWGIGP